MRPVARSNALQDARRPTHATATVAVAAIVIMAADEAKRFGALLNGVAKRVVFGDGDFSDDVLKNEIYPNADEKSERARARARLWKHKPVDTAVAMEQHTAAVNMHARGDAEAHVEITWS